MIEARLRRPLERRLKECTRSAPLPKPRPPLSNFSCPRLPNDKARARTPVSPEQSASAPRPYRYGRKRPDTECTPRCTKPLCQADDSTPHAEGDKPSRNRTSLRWLLSRDNNVCTMACANLGGKACACLAGATLAYRGSPDNCTCQSLLNSHQPRLPEQ